MVSRGPELRIRSVLPAGSGPGSGSDGSDPDPDPDPAKERTGSGRIRIRNTGLLGRHRSHTKIFCLLFLLLFINFLLKPRIFRFRRKVYLLLRPDPDPNPEFFLPFFEVEPVAGGGVDLDVDLPGVPLYDELVESCAPHDDCVVCGELRFHRLVTAQLDLEAAIYLCRSADLGQHFSC